MPSIHLLACSYLVNHNNGGFSKLSVELEALLVMYSPKHVDEQLF
jgi:hypothetical protein